MYGLAESYSETTASSGHRDVNEVVSINQPHKETFIHSQSVLKQFCSEKLNLEIRPDDIVNCHRLQKSTVYTVNSSSSIDHPMVICFASQSPGRDLKQETSPVNIKYLHK